MSKKELTPKVFSEVHPFASVMKNAECEWLAQRILEFTNSWEKPLTWEEYYETMSEEDKQVEQMVKNDFYRIKDYLKSPETCAEFSPAWEKIVYKTRK